MRKLVVALACLIGFSGMASAQDFQAGTRATSASGTAGVVGSGSAAVGTGATLGGSAFLGGGFANATGSVGIGPGPALVSTTSSNNLAGAGVISGAASTGSAGTIAGGVAASGSGGVGQAGWAFAFPGPIVNPPLGPEPVIVTPTSGP